MLVPAAPAPVQVITQPAPESQVKIFDPTTSIIRIVQDVGFLGALGVFTFMIGVPFVKSLSKGLNEVFQGAIKNAITDPTKEIDEIQLKANQDITNWLNITAGMADTQSDLFGSVSQLLMEGYRGNTEALVEFTEVLEEVIGDNVSTTIAAKLRKVNEKQKNQLAKITQVLTDWQDNRSQASTAAEKAIAAQELYLQLKQAIAPHTGGLEMFKDRTRKEVFQSYQAAKDDMLDNYRGRDL